MASSVRIPPGVRAIELQLARTMTGSERIRVVFQLNAAYRARTLAEIRRRHPEYDDDEAKYALFRILVGDELFRRAYPHAPVLAP